MYCLSNPYGTFEIDIEGMHICSFLCLDTGEGSQCSYSQSCSAHPHLADQGFPLDGRGLPCYDTESMSVYHIIVGEVFGVSVKSNRKIEAIDTPITHIDDCSHSWLGTGTSIKSENDTAIPLFSTCG